MVELAYWSYWLAHGIARVINNDHEGLVYQVGYRGSIISEIIDPIFVDLIYNGKLVTGSIKPLTQLIFSRKCDA